MNQFLKTAFFFLLFDGVYLSLTQSYFQRQIKAIQGSSIKINLWKLLFTYIILIVGYYYFVILKKLSLLDAFLLGLFVYAVYEFTNYSLFEEWSWFTVLIDTLWGGILFTLVRYFSTF
jgi:uncharacterized membrane protein